MAGERGGRGLSLGFTGRGDARTGVPICRYGIPLRTVCGYFAYRYLFEPDPYSNEYLDAHIDTWVFFLRRPNVLACFDTAENDHCKVCPLAVGKIGMKQSLTNIPVIFVLV